MYRHRAPVLIHVLADGRSARRGALGGSAAPGLQHLNSVSAAHAASAHLVGPGGFSQRVGEEDGLMVAVLFLSHPGMNLFFQFWHWGKKRQALTPQTGGLFLSHDTCGSV